MQWALVAVVLIGLFLISGRYPKIAFGVFGLLVLSIFAALLLTGNEEQRRHRDVVPADIVLSNVSVSQAYAGSYRLSGRLKNNSEQSELRESTLNVSLLDCNADGDCNIVGQESPRLPLKVPAGQARDFSVNLYFGAVSVLGTAQWRYEVVATSG